VNRNFPVHGEHLDHAFGMQRVNALCPYAARFVLAIGFAVATLPGVPSAAIRRSTSGSVEAAITQGQKQRADGHFAEALETFQRAAESAGSDGDWRDQAKALMFAGVCQVYLFQYRPALISLNRARQLASQENDKAVEGGAAFTLSTVYELLGDFSLAIRDAEQGVALLRHAGRDDYLVKALLNLANVQSDDGNPDRAIQTYNEAIAVATRDRMPEAESLALDQLGISLVLAGRLSEAEAPLGKARRIRSEKHDENLPFTIEHLAELELAKQHYAAGLKLIDEAISLPSKIFKTSPQYYPVHIRGELLLGLGRKSEALAEFDRAVGLANEWREGALPGDATSIRTSSHLHPIYEDYVELAAQLSLDRRDESLAREAWAVLAENRAATLREQMNLYLDRAGRLPPKYFELLSILQDAEARFTLGSDRNDGKIKEIKAQLNTLSNEIGISPKNLPTEQEKIFRKKSLRSIQEKLSAREVLLSFCLGKSKSFLWTVTRERMKLYRLAPETEIAEQAVAFSDHLRTSQDGSAAGRFLSQSLFGQLDQQAWSRGDWLVSPDGALLNGVPFAALPDLRQANTTLATGHTLRFLPSELLLLRPTGTNSGRRFVGIADPIYNLADSRRLQNVALVNAKTTNGRLARLVGSAREIRRAAQATGMPEIQFLIGKDASQTGLHRALLNKPDVLHFAVHVVSPNGQPEQAALALSLTPENVPELLTPEAIAAYRVLGSLVVMSGCSSEQGQRVPSAGVIGLSRAWLLAGATAVIVSAWPTPDDSGQFFSSFYSHFRPLSPSRSFASRAAIALQQAQEDMQRSSGYRSSPSFWAAYSVISKE